MPNNLVKLTLKLDPALVDTLQTHANRLFQPLETYISIELARILEAENLKIERLMMAKTRLEVAKITKLQREERIAKREEDARSDRETKALARAAREEQAVRDKEERLARRADREAAAVAAKMEREKRRSRRDMIEAEAERKKIHMMIAARNDGGNFPPMRRREMVNNDRAIFPLMPMLQHECDSLGKLDRLAYEEDAAPYESAKHHTLIIESHMYRHLFWSKTGILIPVLGQVDVPEDTPPSIWDRMTNIFAPKWTQVGHTMVWIKLMAVINMEMIDYVFQDVLGIWHSTEGKTGEALYEHIDRHNETAVGWHQETADRWRRISEDRMAHQPVW